MPGTAFRTDRKAVLGNFRSGCKTATASSVELGRLWRLVFAALDDFDEPHVDVDFAWMPAHTKGSDIGLARLSNGSLLTKRDRLANNAADCLAKYDWVDQPYY